MNVVSRSRAMCALVLAVASASLLGGCRTYRAPSFDVERVAMEAQTADGYVLRFRLRGENPNEVALPLRTVRYALVLDGRTVFSGERSAEATLPRFGSQELSLPVAVALGADGAPPIGDVRYRLEGSVVYELPGSIAELLFDAKIRRPRAPLVASGTLAFDAGPGGGGVREVNEGE